MSLTRTDSTSYIQPTLASQPIQIDPAAPGTVIRYAMGIEAAFNVLGATGMIFQPSQTLDKFVTDSSLITPLSISFVQWLGAMVFTLTVPLLLAIPNTRRGIESRQITYYTLLSGELFLIPLMCYQGFVKEDSGLSSKAMLLATIQLGLIVVWRWYVLMIKPVWLGRYRDVKKDL